MPHHCARSQRRWLGRRALGIPRQKAQIPKCRICCIRRLLRPAIPSSALCVWRAADYGRRLGVLELQHSSEVALSVEAVLGKAPKCTGMATLRTEGRLSSMEPQQVAGVRLVAGAANLRRLDLELRANVARPRSAFVRRTIPQASIALLVPRASSLWDPLRRGQRLGRGRRPANEELIVLCGPQLRVLIRMFLPHARAQPAPSRVKDSSGSW
mmetsp:Transcript_102076/g.243430  ORF Transcript_102076/g.243430 Transcript_102076/m.243430 type:complete len:212 (+) Transcript_102076:959-1594(+)